MGSLNYAILLSFSEYELLTPRDLLFVFAYLGEAKFKRGSRLSLGLPFSKALPS